MLDFEQWIMMIVKPESQEVYINAYTYICGIYIFIFTVLQYNSTTKQSKYSNHIPWLLLFLRCIMLLLHVYEICGQQHHIIILPTIYAYCSNRRRKIFFLALSLSRGAGLYPCSCLQLHCLMRFYIASHKSSALWWTITVSWPTLNSYIVVIWWPSIAAFSFLFEVFQVTKKLLDN